MRLLVVEDVDTMRELLRHVLEQITEIQVTGLVRNGWEARVELTRRRPDLILLDEILPGESSVDLLREFVSQGIPVILLTGLDDPTHEIPPEALGRMIKPGWKSMDQDRKRMATQIREMVEAGQKRPTK